MKGRYPDDTAPFNGRDAGAAAATTDHFASRNLQGHIRQRDTATGWEDFPVSLESEVQ